MKNVIVVLEWVPNPKLLHDKEGSVGLTPVQEQQLREAFNLLDADGNGQLSPTEAKQVGGEGRIKDGSNQITASMHT